MALSGREADLVAAKLFRLVDVEGLADVHRSSDTEGLEACRERQVLLEAAKLVLSDHEWCGGGRVLFSRLSALPCWTLRIVEDLDRHFGIS